MHYFWIAMRYYATFNGRTSQRGYWYFQLILSIVSLICVGIPLIYYMHELIHVIQLMQPQIKQHVQQAMMQQMSYTSQSLSITPWSNSTIPNPWYISLLTNFGTIFGLATIVPSLAINVRRLHDTNRSGTLLWLALIPIIGWIILLVWLCQSGQAYDNRYGPDPADTRSGTTMPEIQQASS